MIEHAMHHNVEPSMPRIPLSFEARLSESQSIA